MNTAKPTVYIETSIISYLAARPSVDVIAAGRQALTWRWWDSERPKFALVTSQAVINEIRLGDAEAAARRLEIIGDVPLVPDTPMSFTLAESLAHRMALPARANADAVHISVASTSGVHYLLTWNCTHIANATLRPIIEQTCRAHGFEPPVICTPEELLDA